VNETNANTRRRVRRVTRILREIDPWSVFKVAIVFHFVLYIVVMVSLVLLWNVANATGTINNIENFLESFGWDSFEFNGGELFRNVWILGLFAVVLATGIWVLLAVVFNLITELVGGIRVSVLEEEVVERVGEP
jgi:ethanolamine transporter EutH